MSVYVCLSLCLSVSLILVLLVSLLVQYYAEVGSFSATFDVHRCMTPQLH